MELLKEIGKKALRNGCIDTRVKASTLIETIFAMLVIMLSFSIAITIFSRLITNNTSNQQLKANSIIGSEIETIKRSKSFFDQRKIVENNWTLSISFELFENSSDRLVLTAVVQDSTSKVIDQQKEIVYLEE
jgi:hypothetical protein